MNRFRSKQSRKPKPSEPARTPLLLPVLDLPDTSRFRTSLILPHLTQRFALLRDDEGALVSFETMQSHLKAQRANGRLTEDEELAVLHEFSMQSAQEARAPSPRGNFADVVPPRSAPLLSSWSTERLSESASPLPSPSTLEDFHRMRARAASSTSQASRFGGARDLDPFRGKTSPSTSLPNLSSPTRVESEAEEHISDLPSGSLSRPRPRLRDEAQLSASQIHRISRVLDDIELQLHSTHRPREDPGDITVQHTSHSGLLGAPSPAKSRLTDEDTEEIDPHMGALHRSLAASPALSFRQGAQLGVPVYSPPYSRSASAQGSLYETAGEEADDGRSLTPVAAHPSGSPATLRHTSSLTGTTTTTTTTGSPNFSPVASRFPTVPERNGRATYHYYDDSEEDQDITEEVTQTYEDSSKASSTNPPSFNMLSPILNASTSSLASAGSSYNSDEPGDDQDLFDTPEKRRPEPFEFETASHYHEDRSTVAKLSQENLGGLDLADIAFIQDALVRSASTRAAGRSTRSGSTGSASENGHGGRLGSATPLSMERLDEETEDLETAEELDTPLLTSDASHSPKNLFQDGPPTPSSERSITSSPATKPPRPPISSMHRSVASQSSDLASSVGSQISRTPISNPSYTPGRVQRFPVRTTSNASNASSSQGHHSINAHLQEQVAAHASAATAALKRGPPMSPTSTSPTLRRHKSTKSIKLSDIGSPQLVATSANLSRLANNDLERERAASPPPMPPISPHHVRKQSSTTALRSKILRRFDSTGRTGPNGDEISPYDLPPISATTEATPSTPPTPQGWATSPEASFDGHASPLGSVHPSPSRGASPVTTPTGTGIGRVLSRFRKAKSPTAADINSTRSSPAMPSPPISQPTSPGSIRPLAAPLPLKYTSVGLGLDGNQRERQAYAAPNEWRSRGTHPTGDGPTTAPLTFRPRPAPPPFSAPLPSPPISARAESPEAPSRHDSGVESIRQLMQAAADLGIDADKVSDLIASSYEGPLEPSRTVVRRTVILAASPPPEAEHGSSQAPGKSSAGIRRSQTLREPGSQGQGHRHRRTSSEAGASINSAQPRRSIAERSPTPPPDAAHHRRRRSADLLREPMPPVPKSPTLSGSMMGSTFGKTSSLGVPSKKSPTHAGSFRTDRTPSSYAGSLFDFYGDEAIPEDETMVLASGRVPAPGEAAGPHGPMTGVPSSVVAGARVEVDEMQDGSLVWQVVRNLRTSDVSDPTGAFHSRQSSNASSLNHLQPPAAIGRPLLGRLSATSAGSISAASVGSQHSAEALKLMIRRDRSARTSEAGIEVNPARPSFSSERSVQVYEAESADVGALIDELSKGDTGSFNLVRERSLQRVLQRRPPARALSP